VTDLLPSAWIGWWIGFIHRVAGRAAAPSSVAIGNISAPPAGRIFSLFRIHPVRFVAGRFQIRVEMIIPAEFAFHVIHSSTGPIPGRAIQEKK
jgi:hypothetical protein